MTVNHTETVRCKKNNNNQCTAIGHGQSQVQIWKQVDAEKQHDSHTSSVLPCDTTVPSNTVYSGSRDLFKFC